MRSWEGGYHHRRRFPAHQSTPGLFAFAHVQYRVPDKIRAIPFVPGGFRRPLLDTISIVNWLSRMIFQSMNSNKYYQRACDKIRCGWHSRHYTNSHTSFCFQGHDSIVARGSREPDPSKDTVLTIEGKSITVPQGKPKLMPAYQKSRFSSSEYLVRKNRPCDGESIIYTCYTNFQLDLRAISVFRIRLSRVSRCVVVRSPFACV